MAQNNEYLLERKVYKKSYTLHTVMVQNETYYKNIYYTTCSPLTIKMIIYCQYIITSVLIPNIILGMSTKAYEYSKI